MEPQPRATSERSRSEGEVMISGLNVHAETLAAAITEPDSEVRSLGTLPNWVGVSAQAVEEA
jgi:hypothetical protein